MLWLQWIIIGSNRRPSNAWHRTKDGGLLRRFFSENIPRGNNEQADLLAKSAAQELPLPSEIFFETLKAPSVELIERAVLTILPVHSKDWRTEIVSFLQGNYPSDDKVYIKMMHVRTRPYVIIEGNCSNKEFVPVTPLVLR
jgi:hypothetical protein